MKKKSNFVKDYPRKMGKCCWGNCDSCGVIPCLYKLYKGEVIDEADKIRELKDKFLNV